METGLIGPIVMVVFGSIGGIGGYFTVKARIDFLNGLLKDLRSDHESSVKRGIGLEEKSFALELRIEREFVKKFDLQDVESRIGKRLEGVETSVNKRLDNVEHTVKNGMAQILGAMSDRVRQARRPAE